MQSLPTGKASGASQLLPGQLSAGFQVRLDSDPGYGGEDDDSSHRSFSHSSSEQQQAASKEGEKTPTQSVEG